MAVPGGLQGQGLDLCINRVVILEFVVVALVAAIFLIAFRKPKVVPRGTQNFMESIYDVVARDIVEGVMGRRGIGSSPT